MFRYQFFLQLKQSRKPESSTSDVESTILFSSFISKFRRMLFSTITSTVDIYKSLSIVPVIIQTYFTVTEKKTASTSQTPSATPHHSLISLSGTSLSLALLITSPSLYLTTLPILPDSLLPRHHTTATTTVTARFLFARKEALFVCACIRCLC